jgi:hypothetical protein
MSGTASFFERGPDGMITIQAISEAGQNLQALLRSAIREGCVESFEVTQVKGGLRLRHKQIGGRVVLEHRQGLLLAGLLCNNKENEWELLQAFVGLLVYCCKPVLAAINIQLGA